MTSGTRGAAAIGSAASGVLGVAAVLVFSTLALLLGSIAIAAGAYARRDDHPYRPAAAVGLVLGAITVVAVLLVVVFLSS
jgi:hypothetical protein